MDSEGKTITTGVDKLVKLVQQNRRISVDDASKILSMPKSLVEEWADFLEEKEVIGIDYKFAKPYLVFKEVTMRASQGRAKAFSDRKEGFVRKIDTVLQYLEQEGQGLPKLKIEFERLTKEVETKFGKARKELDLLAKYDEMKRSVDAQIMQQERKLGEKRARIEEQIVSNKRAASRYLHLIDENRKELSREEIVTNLLKTNEAQLEKKMQAIISEASVYENKIEDDKRIIEETVNRIVKLKDLSNKATSNIEEQKKELTYLIEESKKHEKKIEQIQRGFLDQFSGVKGKADQFTSSELKKIRMEFHRIFSKKFAAEKFINKLELDVTALKKELKELANEAMLLQLGSKTKNIENYSKEFEEKFEKLRKSKEAFHRQVNQLLSTINKP